ncbi:hypothetical protein HW132_33670 [Brasilonema sp. CT11]|nr:hypothetical protein [Brasilonema sp. CT11]
MLTNDSAYQIQSTGVRKQPSENRAKSQILRKQSSELLAKSIELKAQFIELGTTFIASQASYMVREQNFRHKQKPKAIDLADVSPPDQLLDFGDSSCKLSLRYSIAAIAKHTRLPQQSSALLP